MRVFLGVLTLVVAAVVCAPGQEPAKPDPNEGSRKYYDGVYAGKEEVFSRAPNGFMVRTISGRKPGRALDVAMGQGRNALWLASHGWTVTGFDISPVAIEESRKEADRRGLRIEAIVSPYEDFDWGREKWDLIVFSYFFPQSVLAKVWDSLKPGGLILVEGFQIDTARVRPVGGGYHNNELFQVLKDYRVLVYEDVQDRQEWGLPYGETNRLVRARVRSEERSWSSLNNGSGHECPRELKLTLPTRSQLFDFVEVFLGSDVDGVVGERHG